MGLNLHGPACTVTSMRMRFGTPKPSSSYHKVVAMHTESLDWEHVLIIMIITNYY
jgi:hypothetical protein